jgi:hypothetical protein
MNHPHYHKQKQESTASVMERGGCMTVPFTPLFILMVFSAVFLMATGETTNPWDLTPTSPNSGVSNQSIDLAVTDQPVINETAATESSSKESKIREGVQTNSQVKLSPVFTPQVLYWEENIITWAQKWDLDPNLVATVMQIESCGDPKALSRSGAMGLFQVMPYHFSSDELPYKPNTNAKRGLEYLRKALNEHDSVRLAFAGYNGGIGISGKSENYWKDETVRYVYWGTGIYNDAQIGRTSSPRLEEWLSYGGASLCAQANERLGLQP